jgi:superfamily II DNA or RNA helicase
LTYDRRVQSGGNSKNVTVTPTYLFREEDDGLVVPAGLTNLVINTLQNCGVTVTLNDLRAKTDLEPNYANLDLLRPGQDDLIAPIIGNDMGIIWAPTGVGKSFVIRQICKLWDTAQIVICCASKDIVAQTYGELLEMFSSSTVGFVGDGRNESDRRILCVVDKSLMKVNLSKCDVFIYDEVHRAAAPKVAEIVASIQHARMYGFSASPFGRSDKADLETRAMFGDVICKVEYGEAEAQGNVVPVDVWVMPAVDVVGMNKTTTTSMERWNIWRNDSRNERLKEAIEWAFQTYGKDIQVLITVKTVEHAVYLGDVLKDMDFALVYANMDGEDRLRWEKMGMLRKGIHPVTSDQREQMRLDFRDGKLKRAIATSVWGTGVDFPGLNVLVRADGQGGTIPNTQLPGRVTRKADGKTVGIVIDIDDKFHKTLGGRYERRATDYRKRGWQIRYIKSSVAYLTE